VFKQINQYCYIPAIMYFIYYHHVPIKVILISFVRLALHTEYSHKSTPPHVYYFRNKSKSAVQNVTAKSKITLIVSLIVSAETSVSRLEGCELVLPDEKILPDKLFFRAITPPPLIKL
jgi:hypothetical protein